MAALAQAGAAEGLWLRADRQSAGRGRLRRGWTSAPGNLFCSTLVRLRPTDPPAPTLALVTGVAVHEAIAVHVPGAALSLKWPNDVMLGGLKLVGILLERAGDAVVVGIGVNLAAAPEVPGRTVAAVGGGVTPEMLVRTLAEVFARWLARWRGEGLEPVRRVWTAAAHPVGTALSVTLPGEPVLDGLFAGLDADGALRLRTVEGERVIRAGDVLVL